MSDLDQAIREAKQNNAGQAVVDEAKRQAEKKAKEKSQEMAKKGVKKGADGVKRGAKAAHRFARKHSKLYSGLSNALGKGKGALKGLANVAKAGGKAFLKFLATPPFGWVVSAIIIAMIVSLANSGALDNIGSGFGDDDEELFLRNVCEVVSYKSEVDSGVGESDWTTKGTRAYKNAETIFKFWVGQGMSGAGAAGIVGWVNTEGGFAMFGRAEGVYETEPKKGSLKHKVMPIPYGEYEFGGGGVYQFTPYTKYAELGSPDWENSKKMNKFVATQLANGDWNAAVDMTGGNNTFNDMAKGTDPEQTVMMWNAYERADQTTVKVPQKKADALMAYTLFDGEKYSYDDTRFQKNFGKPINADGEPSPVYEDQCARAGESWRGEGGQPTITSGAWRLTDLPEEMKEYAIDPRSMGMHPNQRDTWPKLVSTTGPGNTQTGGQCTDLSASLMQVLWFKDGEALTTKNGNGIDVAPNLANHHGVELSNVPTGGAIFSAETGSKYGHTGIVSHVFDNGDFLIIEQNIGGFSGDSDKTPLTWNYRYVSSSQISKKSYQFFNPEDAGYDINIDALSV